MSAAAPLASPVPVLITQCMQDDFVGPLRAGEALPNRLHIGRAESERLLGSDPGTGPLSQLMHWVRQQPLDAMHVIHIRDWHDPNSLMQREHLQRFGNHCIAGSAGAQMVLGLDREARSNEYFVNAVTLNDFDGTDLGAVLRGLSANGAPLRIGVVGVWTEAKVSFLLYELRTRMHIDDLATCSALTASNSRAQHFNALGQLETILGVEVKDSVADFVGWLTPGVPLPHLAGSATFNVRIDTGDEAPLSRTDHEVVSCLYRGSRDVTLKRLSGGFSGADVFMVTSRDQFGHEQAPSVLKLGSPSLIAKERVAFERVEEVLGNNAPQVRGFVDLNERSGIRFSFAAMGRGGVRTFQSLLSDGAPTPRLRDIMGQVFGDILRPLYAAARPEAVDLLALNGFDPQHAAAVSASVAALTGTDAASDAQITFPDGTRRANVARFYADFLPRLPIRDQEDELLSFGHGDLNGANILVDDRDNAWVIDYFFTGVASVFKDFAKFENDLLYIMTPLRDEAELLQAIRLTDALLAITDLRDPLPPIPDGVTAPALLHAWELLGEVRESVSSVCGGDPDPYPLQLALLSFAARTIGYEEATPLQKRWALAAACGLTELVEQRLRLLTELRVDWVSLPAGEPGRLGITLCPGRRDRNRDLGDDLAQLKRSGATLLVSLLEDQEMADLGVLDLAERAHDAGIREMRVPMKDGAAPDTAVTREISTAIRAELAAGGSVVLACRGGLGRSGTEAAGVLTDLGMSADEAIEAVRAARGARAIDYPVQEDAVRSYADATRKPAQISLD